MANCVFTIVGLLALHFIAANCQQHQKLLSKHNQCGKWNVLAGERAQVFLFCKFDYVYGILLDIDCTAAPRLNVQYTREMYSLQMRLIQHSISPEKHYELVATNLSYALASNVSHFTAWQ